MTPNDDPNIVPDAFKNMSQEKLAKLAWEYHKRLREMDRSFKENPFICGGSEDKDEFGLPSLLFICPVYGLDGFATYKMVKPYSGPSY